MPGASRIPPLQSRRGAVPDARVLSNGHYRTLVTATGTGCAALDSCALTPWHGDRVSDADGFALYLRDLDSGRFWSFGPGVDASQANGSARWQPGAFEIRRQADDVEAVLEIVVPPDAPLELRRVTLHNRSRHRRRIELSTYAEVVLNEPGAHASHPAFSKLFVQTEFVPESQTLLARRRPRAPDEAHPWMLHALLEARPLQFETDRVRFVGRGSRVGAPRALVECNALSGTTGNVLDPILCLRWQTSLDPGERTQSTFLLGAAADRATALELVARFALPGAVDSGFAAARTAAVAELHQLGLGSAVAEELQALAGAMFYGDPALRAAPAVLQRSHGRPADLLRHGIDPERHLAVVHAEQPAGAALVPQFAMAARYWRCLGLPIDVVVLHDGVVPAALADDPAAESLLLLNCNDLAAGEVDLLDTVARLVATTSFPAAAPRAAGATTAPAAEPGGGPRAHQAPPTPGADVFVDGRFAAGDDAYVIGVESRPDGSLLLPPCAWINVVANPEFGCLVSETGATTTWSRNSREHRLTPWSNDPLVDPHGEALYLRDETTGCFWSPLPGPAPEPGRYEMRHGFGASVCRHTSGELEQEVTLFVPLDAPYQARVVRLTNRGVQPRRLSLWSYARLVLGRTPEDEGRFVVTEHDTTDDLLLAHNRLADEFATGVAFAAVVGSAPGMQFSCDRAAFLGIAGTPARPAALVDGGPLDGRTGAGQDACFVQRVTVHVAPGATVEVSFLLGEALGSAAAGALVAAARRPGCLARQLDAVREFWRQGLHGIQISTPSPALDRMVNGWLPYQNLACRIWGRSALYQSGGAYGFRDQLQDATALVHLWPERTRAQILLHAAHQFQEGDVLHWWHPPLGRGIRTRFADDLLWLPYLTATYVRTTGDWAVLDEPVRFLAARPLEVDEDEAYLLPEDSGESADLYTHCCRAIDRAAARGAHDLPLFGTGDWNDGMNRVGREGRGESVWMAFFLVHLLDEFVPLCARRGDSERALRLQRDRTALVRAANTAGWDGAWYRRGYYDDGTPLGSASDDECRIDALAQAWAVLSGAASRERGAQALDAVQRHLVSEPDGIVRLLAPPFENTPHDPGYIKGYVPGVRENGGQYTHAALWVVRALAEFGRRDAAARLLEMLNPASHTRTPEQMAVYQVEPYVIAADVYGAPPHVGRGGWTWYTGSAGWMYRVALETILGFGVVEGEALHLAPRIPDHWPEFSIDYRVPGTTTEYSIRVTNPDRRAERVVSVTLDGAAARRENGTAVVPIRRDGRRHHVEITLGAKHGGDA